MSHFPGPTLDFGVGFLFFYRFSEGEFSNFVVIYVLYVASLSVFLVCEFELRFMLKY